MSEQSDVQTLLQQARTDYEQLRARRLSLDLTRGKPGADQLDLSDALGTLPGEKPRTRSGVDARNYGGLEGLPELREIFAPQLAVPVDQLVVGGNSSLELMHDTLVTCLLSAPLDGAQPWSGQQITFLCPVPGYDRHFALTERFGIRMVAVPMNDEGPDMDVVERLVAGDPQVKGIWCVPRYSNPTGICYSKATVKRLAEMDCAAKDFRIFWDDAYAMHPLRGAPAKVSAILEACTKANHPNRAFVFASTSKVTWAGAGVSFFGSSAANVQWWLRYAAVRTIGPDKVNQLRHVALLRDSDGLSAHMAKHAELIAPKFEAVQEVLREQLDGTGLATWTNPDGGYFVTLRVADGCASRVVQLAKDAGIALTPAGSTHPYGKDPDDAVIRLAPTFPSLDDVRTAMAGVAVCVRLAGYEKLSS